MSYSIFNSSISAGNYSEVSMGGGTIYVNGVLLGGTQKTAKFMRITLENEDGTTATTLISTGTSINIEVKAETVESIKMGSGNIKVVGSVQEAKTGSGDIEVSGNVGGSATTGSGDIKVKGAVTGRCSTGSGNIYKS